MRSIYRDGYRCNDCGWEKPVTRVQYWVDGWQQFYCSDCKRQYDYPRGNLQPVKGWRRGKVREDAQGDVWAA